MKKGNSITLAPLELFTLWLELHVTYAVFTMTLALLNSKSLIWSKHVPREKSNF